MNRIVIASAIVLLYVPSLAAAQGWNVPAESQRCPSKWGAGDELGSGNHMKNRETVLRGARLIKTGEVIELGHVLGAGMPFFGTRIFNLHTKRTFMNTGRNTRGSNEEVVTSEIGQVGTQFDGFAHQTHGDSLYNCFKVSETATRSGFTKLGVQNAPTFFARGVMLDIAALKGVEMLGDTYEITVADLQQALERQKLKLLPGDAVIIHTGWGKLWGKDNARFVKSTPGVGVAAAEWIEAGSAARRLGQLAGRSLAEPRQGPEPAGAPDLPGGERHPYPGEPEARRAGGQARVRIRVHHAAAQDPRGFGLERRAGGDPLIRGAARADRQGEQHGFRVVLGIGQDRAD
jgi:kynurenine formamidase